MPLRKLSNFYYFITTYNHYDIIINKLLNTQTTVAFYTFDGIKAV